MRKNPRFAPGIAKGASFQRLRKVSPLILGGAAVHRLWPLPLGGAAVYRCDNRLIVSTGFSRRGPTTESTFSAATSTLP